MFVIAVLLAVAGTDQAVPPPQPAPNRADVTLPPPKRAEAPTEVGEVVIIAPTIAPEPDWSRTLNLNVRGDFSQSDTPYLRQRPVNGCKLMAGGAKSPSGKSGAAGGMVCAKSF